MQLADAATMFVDAVRIPRRLINEFAEIRRGLTHCRTQPLDELHILFFLKPDNLLNMPGLRLDPRDVTSRQNATWRPDVMPEAVASVWRRHAGIIVRRNEVRYPGVVNLVCA